MLCIFNHNENFEELKHTHTHTHYKPSTTVYINYLIFRITKGVMRTLLFLKFGHRKKDKLT